ncbi:2-deoxy-D-gluconate 3-dehydrogenase [Tepidanaerobacter syntrophicus]|uniref:SDR family NAD(P)-dependent oxidoreductase n=1 Tax=Tepidanaerobacter syntrophicus TaxID=224999 RepID=UPI0022EEFBB7|nr:SDR family NAD(P)-dependent oxidoreductase [Tepidanaerobacter syntrophicus]GLI50327.1 2-deoxy-D-gluconate 3-dehydrogenase [Tepidanaerobacter syntrophicus]
MNLFDITGRKAIVTGGTRGLGYGMAEGLMEAGAEVVIFGSNAKVNNVAEQFCEKGFKCHGVEVDLKNREDRRKAFYEGLELLGGTIDILVNSAGIQRRHKSETFPLSDWDDVIEVNLTATFELCQLAGREMLKVGYGKIINIASMISFFGGMTIPAYAASKGGVSQITKALCNEWAGRGINVNAIAPGYMDTDMNTALTDPSNLRFKEITNRIPQHRWGTPNDMKGCCIFLSSHASDYINGAIIPVDGGYLVM